MKEHVFAFSVLTELEKQLPFYLVGAGYLWRQENISRPFGYPYFQWVQVSRGNGSVTIDGRSSQLSPGQAMLLYPGVPHEYHRIGEEFVTSWFTFGGYHLENLLATLGLGSSGVYSVGDGTMVESRVATAVALISSGEPTAGLTGSAEVYAFLLELFPHVGDQPDTYQELRRRLAPAFDHIERHYASPIGMEDLSDAVGVSQQYFCRLFKRATGNRPMEYLNRLRINKAKTLFIEDPARQVASVALAVGYENESYFGRVFRKIEGMSPREFKSSKSIGA